MAIPAYGGASAALSEGTTTVNPGIPAGVSTGDLMLACGAGSNVNAWTVSNDAGGSWTSIAQGDVGTISTTANSCIFSDYYNGTQTAPTFNTPGNNGVMRIIYITGARSGDEAGPFGGRVQDMDGGSSADTSCDFVTGLTTTDADCLIVLVAAAADDSPTFGATWTNANLASITNRVTDVTTQGNDSSLSVVTGTLAVAGAVGTWSNTLSGAGSINTSGAVVAIRPPGATATWSGLHTPDRAIYTAV